MKNLNVAPEELYDPTEAEINRYTGDKQLQETVREQLTLRRTRTRELVRKERDRISELPPTPRCSVVQQDITADTNVFEELEKERIQKLNNQNRKEARQLILSILVEKEMQDEARELRQKETEKSQKLEEENKQKHAEDRKKNEKILQRQIEEENRKKAEEEEKRRQQQEQDEKSQQIKKEEEKKRVEYFKRIELERQEKNKKAKEQAALREEER
jgi:hypothetical protein